MKKKIVIRQAKFSDISGLINVNQECLPENYPRDFWVNNYHIGKQHCFVAELSKTIIGYIFCNNTTIISFAVLSPYRGKKIGKELMNHCLNTFTISNTPVILHVRANNQTAISLYTSYKFTINETIVNYYINPIEDAHIMKWVPHNEEKYTERKKINV